MYARDIKEFTGHSPLRRWLPSEAARVGRCISAASTASASVIRVCGQVVTETQSFGQAGTRAEMKIKKLSGTWRTQSSTLPSWHLGAESVLQHSLAHYTPRWFSPHYIGTP